jgi:hypothetical protein
MFTISDITILITDYVSVIRNSQLYLCPKFLILRTGFVTVLNLRHCPACVQVSL